MNKRLVEDGEDNNLKSGIHLRGESSGHRALSHGRDAGGDRLPRGDDDDDYGLHDSQPAKEAIHALSAALNGFMVVFSRGEAEAVTLMRKMQKMSPSVKVVQFGTTSQGRAMYALIVSPDHAFTPAAAAKTNKAVILIQSGIHSGEIMGKDVADRQQGCRRASRDDAGVPGQTKSDPTFAADPQARLDWWITRSNYQPSAVNRYPIPEVWEKNW